MKEPVLASEGSPHGVFYGLNIHNTPGFGYSEEYTQRTAGNALYHGILSLSIYLSTRCPFDPIFIDALWVIFRPNCVLRQRLQYDKCAMIVDILGR